MRRPWEKDTRQAYASRCPNGAVACERQGSMLASVLPGFSSARPFWLGRGTLLGEKVSLACACDERSNDCCRTDSTQGGGMVAGVWGQSRGGCGQESAILPPEVSCSRLSSPPPTASYHISSCLCFPTWVALCEGLRSLRNQHFSTQAAFGRDVCWQQSQA